MTENATEPVSQPQCEIVVAHYDEDLLWLTPAADIVTVYSKGKPDFSVKPPPTSFARHITLPNIGRESHTYLYHIVNNYNHLADITLFTQGQVSDHVGTDLSITDMLHNARRRLPSERFIVYTKYELKLFDAWSRIPHVKKWKAELQSGGMRPAKDTPRGFWKWVFGMEAPSVVTFGWGAIFAVSGEAVQQRPREFYERILRVFESINHVNPEEGHYMERFWLNVFVPDSAPVSVIPCLVENGCHEHEVNEGKFRWSRSNIGAKGTELNSFGLLTFN